MFGNPLASLFRSRKPVSESQFTRLPQELVDMVLDELHNDKYSLCAGSLVSRSWLRAAQTHLFASITLTKSTDFTGLNALLEESPRLADFVLTVTFYGDLPFSLGADAYEWLEDAFKIVSKLKNIRKINWWAFDWGVVETLFKDRMCTFPPVSELCADGVRFASVENLVLFFRTFSTVTSLTLRDIHVTGLDLSAMPLLFSHSPPRLQQLFLMSNGANGPLIDLLLLPHFEFDLRCLHTAWTPQLCLENHFQTLCGVVASTVQELLVVIKCNPSQDLINCLRSFTQLRRLTFTLADPKSDYTTVSTWLESAIDQLPPSLEQTVFDFSIPSCSLDELDTSCSEGWLSVDQKLADRGRFANLAAVSFQGCFSHSGSRHNSVLVKPDQKARQIAGCFPALMKRGLVRVFRGAEDSRVLLFP